MIRINLRKRNFNAQAGVFLLALFVITVSALTLSGCGQLFSNTKGDPKRSAQKDSPEDAGIPGQASFSITPSGKDLTILTLNSIRAPKTTTRHTSENTITVRASTLSEIPEYVAVHEHEIAGQENAEAVYTTDSALGCAYQLEQPGTTRERLSNVRGSCVKSISIELPDHEVPRAFIGTTPLFSGEISLADLKAVYASATKNALLLPLLQTYAARVPKTSKPVAVSDLNTFIPALGSDAKRIDAVTILAPFIRDPANAEAIARAGFTTEANQARAVKILAAFE